MAFQPKSYRKFIATAATATIVASAVAPAASAASFSDVSDRYKDAVDYLVSKDITQGMSATKFGTGMNIKRVDAAVMIAKALKLDTESAPSAGFTDVPERGQGAVNALKAAGIINGKSDTHFGASENMTRAEMAKVIANAYKLTGSEDLPFTDVSDTFAQYVKALYENDITGGKTATHFGSNDNVTRGEFALFVYRAENQTPEVVEVSSVDPVNAKTINVQFNQPLDEKTIDAISVVKGTDAADAGTVTSKLSADGKTLTFKASTYFKGDYTVKVPFEAVKSTKGTFVAPINQKVTVNDMAAPMVSSADAKVKATTDAVKSLTLTFDEEVSSIDFVKINNVNYDSSDITIVGNKATVAVNDLDATKSYDVTVVNATDAVGNVKEVQSAPLSVMVDNKAPSITKVEATGENTVKVTLDKELKDDTLNITGKVGTFDTNIVSDATVNPDNKMEYTLTLDPNYLFKNGNTDTVTFTVAKDALSDDIGNTNADAITKSVMVSKDATAPSVEKVETTVENGDVTGFKVTYSEDVQAVDASKVSVVNSKGEILSFANVASAAVSATDSKQVVFTLDPSIQADKYSFDFAEGFVTDKALSPNKSTANSFTVDVTDADKPVETSFTIADATAADNVVTVDFGEKVKATGNGSALSPAAYQLNGTALPADTKIEFAKTAGVIDQTKVNITLPEGFVKTSDTKAIFRVTGVQTLDNKVNNSFIAPVEVTDNTAPEATSFVATDLDKLTVTYSEALADATAPDVTDEVKLFDSKGASIAITSATVVDGKLVLTVANAAAVSKLTTTTATTVDIKDAAGNKQMENIVVNK
ncbi:S-layer homology domain-containing protein [Falsibacillus albus]|uniref:S-layer homology domain-containing protein n=1 Tax=Falsibacillus albus TaxID=2478915 RepID=A0A3L7K1Z7_9BACI|nr:S-layer homology domain-containing protein [Falsibacillus albus]RLQ96820.1 S-layer homology domain-containing protein [Falsibacillus albus]